MDVYINNQPLTELPHGLTVDTLLHTLQQTDPDCFVSTVLYNDAPVEDAALDDLLPLPLASPGRLDIQTTSASQLSAELLTQVIDVLGNAAPEHAAVAELIAAGKTQPAMDRLGHCLSAWNSAEQSLTNALQLTRLALDDLSAAHVSRLRDLLEKIRQCLSARDLVAVADIMEYDLAPLAHTWRALLDDIRRRLLTQGPPNI